MNKLKWWFRVVGGFYLLLTAMNLYGLFLGGAQMYTDTLPAPMNSEPLAGQAFADAWLVFVFEMGVLGVMAFVASKAPIENRIMAWFIIWAEVFRGAVADAIWIARGYSASYYIFIAIHLVIILTGIVFLRQANAK